MVFRDALLSDDRHILDSEAEYFIGGDREWSPGDAPEAHPLWEQQIALERGMLRAGADAFRDRVALAQQRKQMDRLRPVSQLLQDWIPLVGKHLTTWRVNEKKRTGPKSVALPYIQEADAYVCAAIALRAVLDGITVERPQVTPLAVEIGRTIEHELKVRAWEANEPELFSKVERMLDMDRATPGHRRTVHVLKFNELMRTGKFGFGWASWGTEAMFRVGVLMLDCIYYATGRFEFVTENPYADSVKKRSSVHRVPMVFVPKPELVAHIQAGLDRAEVLSPQLKPTLIPPKRWTGTKSGGYYTPYVMTPRLVQFHAQQENQKARAADEYDAIDMPHVYDALHVIQEVGWTVNARVLDIAVALWSRDLPLPGTDIENTMTGMGGLPRITNEDQPVRSSKHEKFLAERDAARRKGRPDPEPSPRLAIEMKKWMRRAKGVGKRNARRFSYARQTTDIIQLAQEFNGKEFYFPHRLDFRGRMYPIPYALQPQGTDLARGLLCFSKGKAVTEEGAGWLAIMVANHWGNDKISYSDRIDWVYQREDQWRRIAADPMGNLEWAELGKVSSPWQALASIFEWVGYLEATEQGLPYVAHRPCLVDGTCNGIQHLSALTRDEIGGAAVNLVPAPKPADIYQNVADHLTEIVTATAEGRTKTEARDYARWWLALCDGKFKRSLTKRQTMVLPYGGTRTSCYEYTQEWLRETHPLPDNAPPEEWVLRAKRCSWMANAMWDVLGSSVRGATGVMDWLQKTAKAVVEINQPIFWVMPSGFVVRHFYGTLKTKSLKVKLSGETVVLEVAEWSEQMDRLSQLRGIPPNFTHSIDASCLIRTIVKCRALGIDTFTGIHDAYGGHASDMWPIFHVLREAFVEVHRQDLLALFRDGCRTILVDHLVATAGIDPMEATERAEAMLPPRMQLGELDIESVLKSDYFFH